MRVFAVFALLAGAALAQADKRGFTPPGVKSRPPIPHRKWGWQLV